MSELKQELMKQTSDFCYLNESILLLHQMLNKVLIVYALKLRLPDDKIPQDIIMEQNRIDIQRIATIAEHIKESLDQAGYMICACDMLDKELGQRFKKVNEVIQMLRNRKEDYIKTKNERNRK
jgi:hypothetical protein